MPPVMRISRKRCPVCLIEFEPVRGNQRYCSKECREERHRALARERYRSDPARRAKKLDDNRSWFKKNPQKRGEYSKRWRERNPTKVRENENAWARRNRHRIREYERARFLRDPERYRRRNRRRRALKRNAMGDWPISKCLFIELLFLAAPRCYYCHVPLDRSDYHLEHKTPLSRGGKHEMRNLRLSCPICNMQKGTMTAQEFRQEMRSE